MENKIEIHNNIISNIPLIQILSEFDKNNKYQTGPVEWGQSFTDNKFHLNGYEITVQSLISRGSEGVNIYQGLYKNLATGSTQEVIIKTGADDSELSKMLYLTKNYPYIAAIIFGSCLYNGEKTIIMEKLEPLQYHSNNLYILLHYLDVMHSHGLLHTDISINNIMQSKLGHPKFIDVADSGRGTMFYSRSLYKTPIEDITALGRTLLQYKFAQLIADKSARLAEQLTVDKFIEFGADVSYNVSNAITKYGLRKYKEEGEYKDPLEAELHIYKFLYIGLVKYNAILKYIENRRLRDSDFPDVDFFTISKNHRSKESEDLDSYVYNNIRPDDNDFFDYFEQEINTPNDVENNLLFKMARGEIKSVKNLLN